MSISLVSAKAGGSPREITAPYQLPTEYSGGNARLVEKGFSGERGGYSTSDMSLMNPAAYNGQGYPDYRNFQFQPLEPVSMVAYDKYVGPTPESNWVVPGKLLVGAYPASADDAETLDLITSILQNRVTKFVCLQQEVSRFYSCLLLCAFCVSLFPTFPSSLPSLLHCQWASLDSTT
jgi:hypothetical protein